MYLKCIDQLDIDELKPVPKYMWTTFQNNFCIVINNRSRSQLITQKQPTKENGLLVTFANLFLKRERVNKLLI